MINYIKEKIAKDFNVIAISSQTVIQILPSRSVFPITG